MAILLDALLEKAVSQPEDSAHIHVLTLRDVQPHYFSLNSTQSVWHPPSCFGRYTMQIPNRGLALVGQMSPPTYDHARASRWQSVEPLLHPKCPTSAVSLRRLG